MTRLRRVRGVLSRPVHHVRSATWALRQLRRVRIQLREVGLAARVAPPPRRVPRATRRTVVAVLEAGRATCLERSLILQSWLYGEGTQRDVVIGVRNHGEVTAHAWLDGSDEAEDYAEIHRLAPRAAIRA